MTNKKNRLIFLRPKLKWNVLEIKLSSILFTSSDIIDIVKNYMHVKKGVFSKSTGMLCCFETIHDHFKSRCRPNQQFAMWRVSDCTNHIYLNDF